MMMLDALNEYFIVLCRECRMGHIRADLPARPGAEGHSKCPACGRTNPGWIVFGPFAGNYFMSIAPGAGQAAPPPSSSQVEGVPAGPPGERKSGSGLPVRLVVKGQVFRGVVTSQAMDGTVLVKWDDQAFQGRWGATWFPLAKLERGS